MRATIRGEDEDMRKVCEFFGVTFFKQFSPSRFLFWTIDRISPDDAISASRVEEDYTAKKEGEVLGHHDVEVAALQVHVGAAAFMLHAMQGQKKK